MIATLYFSRSCMRLIIAHCLQAKHCDTGAGGDDDPYTMSMRGIDNATYYMLNSEDKRDLLNFSGCGNTVSGNHPVVKDLIIDACLRYGVRGVPSTLTQRVFRSRR